MEWTRKADDRWTCVVPPDGRFTLEIAPKGDGRWAWQVFARGAVNPMATGVARNLGAAKRVTEQLAERGG